MENNTLSFTFHILLPENIERNGQPVVLGDVKELGSWKNPIVKLRQPFPQNPTYWKSDQVTISVSNFEKIQYKYAIHTSKSILFGGEEKIEFEGIDSQDNRTLNIEINDQFDIWKIHGFAFVDYIYDSIDANNFKDKVVEYQRLLTLHNDLTIRASNPKFIINRINNNLKEKRLFLCILLGYYVSKRGVSPRELPNNFPSNLLLNALENYKQEILPLDTKDQMYTAIITLIKHNAFQMKFDWLIIFKIMIEVDPNCTFIKHLKALKYSDENLAQFIERCKIIEIYTENIKLESYVEIAKWLIQLCYDNDSLLKIWNDVLVHNNQIDYSLLECFIGQIRDAVTLECYFRSLSKDYRDHVSGIVPNQVISLLVSPNKKWTYENIDAIKKLLHDNNLDWHGDKVIQSLELISQSHTLELLNIFSEILDDWFRSDFSDTKEKKIPKICVIWFKNLLSKLDTSTSNKNENNFIFSVFQQLELIYPLLGRRINIWRDLTAIAIDRLKNCSEDRIFAATKLIVQIKQDDVKKLFVEIVKDILNKSTLQTHNQFLNKIRIICDCKARSLNVPNMMSEDILYHIMNILQSQSTVSNASEHYLNILKTSKFWNIILRATGSVAKLNTNPFVNNIKTSINELAGFLLEKTIDVQLLQQILEYNDEYLFRHFDAAVAKKKVLSLGYVIISREEIAKLRKICNNYQVQLDVLSKFYNGFCLNDKVTDVADYIRDVKQHLQNSDKTKVKQVLLSDHWAFHEKTMDSAKNCYKFNRSQAFRNIFDFCIKEDAAAINVEYIAQNLIPIVFEKYNAMCKQLKDWEKLKCSDTSLLWKNVTDVNLELDLMEDYKISKSQRFVQTLNFLSKIPHWIQRFEELESVVEMKILKVPYNEYVWISDLIGFLKDDSVELNTFNNYSVDYFDNLSNINQDFWKLIKELSNAEEFLNFLKKIAEHDIKNLINGVDDYSDEELTIQEDTISSFIQVRQFLLPFMNINNWEGIGGFLTDVVDKNPTLGEKVALCNSSNMALQNMYNNIQNREEVTREKIKNAVLNGTFTFTRDQKEDKCLVSLQYPSKSNVKYNLNEILDLRRQALLIANPKNSDIINNKEAEMSKDVMDKFVAQVDIAQEIINIVSMLIQMGHFGYRKFENKSQGTDNMRDYLKFLKEELKNWQNIVDRAQQRCFYLTFFLARHILAFYDYFTSEKLDKDNEKEFKILIRFVNSKAQLPSTRKDIQKILRGSKNYLEILTVIGNELERIFRNVPKQSRKLKATGQRVMSDIVRKGKIFVASCTDKTRVPNIIMSLYANHGYYPEPWQLLICTSSTTMEELTIFIKKSFYASKNGYESHLFCIVNLELLEFELQYNLSNQIRSMQDQKDYLLELIFCRENGVHHRILDQFSSDVKETNGLNNDSMRGIYRELSQNVIRVSSDLSGQGKTEWIKEYCFRKKKVPLSANYPGDVNMFLFKLVTLGMVSTNVDIACLPPSETPTHIFIEIASTTEQHLLNSLPMAGYLLFNHISWNIKNLKASQEINSPIQVTCHYLNLLDRNDIDSKEIFFRTDKVIKEPLPVERCQILIEKYFFNKGNKDTSSFRFVEIFINVLADQLVRFSSSQFFTVDNLKLMVEETSIRNFILRTLIDVSKDFATISIRTKEAQLESTSAIDADDENARLGKIVQWDDLNYLVVFFNSQIPDTISTLYRNRNKVHENVEILLKSQVIKDRTKWVLDNYNSMSPEDLFLKLEYLARRSTEKLDLPEYALSGDNLIKMALILLRARANIPAIVCGEAGCGKTSLISYLALMVEVQFQALNLHAGIDEKAIMMFMNDSLEKAEKGEIWLFFDEINTCNYIGLFADLISHRIFNGKLIHPNIRLFAACNPYRLRAKAQSEAGLTNKVKKLEEQSKLVYQVKRLPDQILDYVWNYGILKPEDEYRYIQIMVKKELKTLAHPVFAELLFASQEFIHKIEERNSERTYSTYPPPGNPTIRTRSYVLALSLCYHSWLYEQDLRKQYRQEMGQILHNHNVYVGELMFAKIIREEQEDYINRMQCPPNTAYNEALLENVLIMVVCILTKIPLFLIGVSGSSKSLAVRLVSSNLCGSDSSDRYFRKLAQVYLIPHQGSSSSTSEGIIKVFEKANKFQETTSKQFPVASVVLLDEVGLAETSPSNPLKILHSLLEPSYPATGPTVSVIGIFNWRLDISKSSRALLVQRPQFNWNNLVDTAERLLNKRAIASDQGGALRPLAEAYSNFEKHGQFSSNFHGLRDYYVLVKYLSLNEMTAENIQMALAHNFRGTDNHVKLCNNYFGNVLKMFNSHKPWTYKQIPIEQLIVSNLKDTDARHLMVIGKSDSIVNLLTYQLRRRDLDPVIILGSQFPDDQEDYYYSVLRRIMLCVEAGKPLILTDLETIYGSLYDLWNQNYIAMGSKDNVKYFTRVALGACANPMLCVSLNFKCILVMDETKLVFADPPLLNRFEKQRLSINDLLDDKQKLLVEYLDNWTNQIITLVKANSVTGLHNRFTQEDLFIGFDKDETLQSLIFHITTNNPEANHDNEILEKCKESLIAIASADGIIRAELSILEQDEVDRWKHVYFNQHHNGLSNYFDALFDQEKLCSDSKGQLVIINTFSKITVDFKSCLQDYLRYQVHNLSIIKTEVQISKIVKDFFFESMDQVLILQCDINSINFKCVKLAKYIIEQFKSKFLTKKETYEINMPIKHACIIFHIRRDYESNLIKSSFICSWKQITIESLKSPELPLTNFLDKSLYKIINSELFDKIVYSTKPFEKILKDELLWCLSCIKYQNSDVNYISTLSNQILSNSIFINCIKTKTFEWILENYKNWQYEVVLDKMYLSKFTCLSLALQDYIRIIIKQTVAKILYSLEKLSAVATFFNYNNNSKESKIKNELSDLWKHFFMDNTIVNISNLSEPKPSIYIISHLIINDLEFPFSYYFFDQINFYKKLYYEELDILKQVLENDDGLIENHLEDFKNNLISIYQHFEYLQKYSELYYKDFIKINLSIHSMKLDFILRHLIGVTEDKIINPFILHIYWWKYAAEIMIQLKLAETFPDLIAKAQNDFIVYGKLDQYLFKESINLILQNICDDKPWKQDMDFISSIYYKINDSKNFSNLYLLFLCNDLLKINTIPLEKVKEIINLGKSTKNKEIITTEIINLVFSNLDNNNNEIPITSFIKRSLNLISLESEIRLTLYKHIFSQYSFKLMNNGIIEKIFTTEIQQNKQIFFMLIKNSEKALQLSIRLKIINDNIKDINSNMAESCCDIIQSIFNQYELNELLLYFKNSIELFTKQEDLLLQQITSIAFLKEFINKYWKNYFQKDNSLSKSLIKEINNIMKISSNLFMQSIQSYFMLILYQQSSFDIKQLEILKKEFTFFENFTNIESITNMEMYFSPKLWKSIKKVNFIDFYAYYNNNLDKYPLLSVFFKHNENLNLIKHLYPIIRFVKILSFKLEYHLTRKLAQIMTFHEFIEKESADDNEYFSLKYLFEEFAISWNSIISHINQYQSEELLNKPYMNLELPVIFGLIEQKNNGIYLCAILDFLIKLHNEFLDDVIDIPFEKCKSLNFIKNLSWNYLNSKTYFIISTVAQAQDDNFIYYEWDDKILKYNRRNIDIKGNANFIFDLQKIEMKLARKLVLDKVYFKTENNQLYLKNFSFKYELFHNSPKILFDIKKVLPQVPIPGDKILMILTFFQQSNSSIILNSSTNLVNLSDLLFLFEIMLCFIKELSIQDNNMLILDFVDQWLKLARYNIVSIDILKEFSLKHIIAYYVLIEEQVANSIIHNIGDKFKIPLMQQMKDSINKFLLVNSNIENQNLNTYILDFTLDLWTDDIKQELIEKLFPTCLLVSHAYDAYTFIVSEIEGEEYNESFASAYSLTARKNLIKKFKKFTG
ncbi:hypothetical protein C1646_816080 [Rhizophagus diaphanus]|nr:hypothetical protein C1646_816080 [Rhizophagus diaphanus] [Rhizophagus sp. MUCL 43196]